MNGTEGVSAEDERAELANPESDPGALGGPGPGEDPRECDVVMKGGITSGVVYPLAVCELARKFRLRNVGGTSAGAIAAALSAAAELGRDAPRSSAGDGRPAGYGRLAGLPEELGGEGYLLALFRPDRRTRSLFRIATTALGRHGKRLAKLRRVLAVLFAASRAALVSWWLWLPLLGAVPGALLLAALLSDGGTGELGALEWAGAAAAVAVLGAGWVLGVAAAVVLLASRRLPENLYGLVRGSGPVEAGEVPRLTDWLSDEIDRTAGRPAGAHAPPLTFGELWRGPAGAGGGGEGGTEADPAVNLEMLTTNLTNGGPLRLPYELTRGYFFDPAEMRRLFPGRVVDHLEASSPSETEMTPSDRRDWQREVALFAARGLLPMPDPANLPVVVATRMSLSFPVLLSAVPLYALDRGLEEPKPERVWFSDGGITSNFPVHFFDSLLPVRPSFGFNLRPFHSRYPKSANECDNIYLPRINGGGILAWWTRWEEAKGLGRLSGFLGAIAGAMQNWVDNAQLPVPGYRDRVVHVSHDEEEGGLNLDMPPDVVRALSERGRCAGELLAEVYTTPPPKGKPVSWPNHRWIRLRSALGLLERLLGEIEEGWSAGSYAGLLDPKADLPSYDMSLKRRAMALGRMDELIATARAWREEIANDPHLTMRGKDAPEPFPAFRVLPAPRRADD